MIRKLAIALIFWLVAGVARADGVPVVISGGGLHYSELDRQITDRIIAVASNNPAYSISNTAPVDDGHRPFISLVLGYADMQDGIITMSVLVILNDKKLPFPGYLGSGTTFCSLADQAQCVLDAGTILQTAVNNYLEKAPRRTRLETPG
ncbi:hypothetical protein AB4Y38_40775 [Paraburkholderia sp. EG285A]|uniref:hypothetical protein n=1 Tax=Paraburkholderia sp. EG285A TaxID=3237009 RepID=UPI0034D2FB9F